MELVGGFGPNVHARPWLWTLRGAGAHTWRTKKNLHLIQMMWGVGSNH